MDTISRTGLLALLNSRDMTQQEIIALVQQMAPVEVDSKYASQCEGVSPASTTDWTSSRPTYDFPYVPIFVPDHMG